MAIPGKAFRNRARASKTDRDAWSLALPLGALLLAAFVAAAVPDWRAARVDPVIALRNK